jgi:hypothetical protein
MSKIFYFLLLSTWSLLITGYFVAKHITLSSNEVDRLEAIRLAEESKPSFVEREYTYLSDNAVDTATTVVSVYIQLSQSKHSINEYDSWCRNFLKSVTSAPLVMFVNEPAFARLRLLRRNLTTKFYLVNDTVSVLRAIEKHRRQNYTLNYFNKQNTIDPERYTHNTDLYILWNSKSFVLSQIAQLNPYKSSFFIYADAGSFRYNEFRDWPDTRFIAQELAPKLNDRILLGQMNYGTIQGTFFGGSDRAVLNFYENFFVIHDMWLTQGKFVGKDQTLMEVVAFDRFANTTLRLLTWDLNCNFNNHDWFWFQVMHAFLVFLAVKKYESETRLIRILYFFDSFWVES